MLEEISVEHLKDRIRILENEKIKLENNFLINQYNQIKGDVRDIDKRIWATPIVVGIITAVILAMSFSLNFRDSLLPVELVLIVVGVLLNFTLYLGLFKLRFFQIYKNKIIDDLENRMPIFDEKKKTKSIQEQKNFDTPSGLIYKATAFKFYAGTTILFISILVGAGVFHTTNLLSNAGVGAVVTIVFLLLILINMRKKLSVIG